MADGVEFSLLGLDELQARVAGVSEEVSGKAANTATKAAARLVARAAAKGAMRIDDPASAAEISKNIWQGGAKYPGVQRKRKRSRPADGDAYRVGVRGGSESTGRFNKKGSPEYASLPGGDTRHWRFWEFGSEDVPARPFLRPALADNINPAINIFVSEYDKAIQKALRKVAKNRAKRSRGQQARRDLFGLAD